MFNLYTSNGESKWLRILEPGSVGDNFPLKGSFLFPLSPSDPHRGPSHFDVLSLIYNNSEIIIERVLRWCFFWTVAECKIILLNWIRFTVDGMTVWWYLDWSTAQNMFMILWWTQSCTFISRLSCSRGCWEFDSSVVCVCLCVWWARWLRLRQQGLLGAAGAVERCLSRQ